MVSGRLARELRHVLVPQPPGAYSAISSSTYAL